MRPCGREPRGTVAAIERDSTELCRALFKAGVRVIITALQKFPFVLKQLAGDATELSAEEQRVRLDRSGWGPGARRSNPVTAHIITAAGAEPVTARPGTQWVTEGAERCSTRLVLPSAI